MKMYRIECENGSSALKKLYRFLTIPELTNPECSVWQKNGMPQTYSEIKNSFPNERAFVNEVIGKRFDAISCVAGSDREDTRRVTLMYTPDVDLLVISFPQAENGLNQEEKRVLDYLTRIE